MCTRWTGQLPRRPIAKSSFYCHGTRWLGAMVSVCRQGRWAPALDTRTVSAILNQNSGSGTSTVTGGCCLSVPDPPLPLQLTVPFQPRFLQELIRAHCPSQPRWSLPRKSPHLTECSRENPNESSSFTSLPTIDSRASGNESSQLHAKRTRKPSTSLAFTSPHAAWILASLAAWRLSNQQQQSSCAAPAKLWEVDAQERSRRALSGRSLGAQHGRTRHHPRGPLQSFPIPARTSSRWPGQAAPE